MAKKGTKPTRTLENMPLIQPHAAGIDVGAEEHWVCVPADRDAQPVQKLSAFTCDLPRLADWLQACGLTTVAMALPPATGRVASISFVCGLMMRSTQSDAKPVRRRKARRGPNSLPVSPMPMSKMLGVACSAICAITALYGSVS